MKTKELIPFEPDFLVHPGEIIKEEFANDLNLSVEELADSLYPDFNKTEIDRQTSIYLVQNVIDGRELPDAEMCARLGKYFGTSFEFWINLTTNYVNRKMKDNAKEIYEELDGVIIPHL